MRKFPTESPISHCFNHDADFTLVHRQTARWTHKELEELEDPLVCENIKCVPRDWVDDRQAVNFVFDEGVHCIK